MTDNYDFPKQPPDGFVDFVERTYLDNVHALLYEAEWVPDYSLAAVLSEQAGKKEKFVRCRCSCCGMDWLMPWAKAGYAKTGYGFIDVEYDGIIESGDDTTCPECGAKLHVKKAAYLRRKGYMVAERAFATSASLTQENNNLVLTHWLVERRVYRDLSEKLVAQAAEAYVFSENEATKLTSWRMYYGGNYGYERSYSQKWFPPAKQWHETMGSKDQIFGLTPQLVADSSMPNCKLDVYMESFRNTIDHYPVVWLRLCQKHPNVENLLISGPPLILHELIAEEAGSLNWAKNNRRGAPHMGGICWKSTRPAQMLGLNKDELRLAKSMAFGAYFWRLFVGAKAHGETLTREVFEEIHSLGDTGLLDLVGEASMWRIVKYLRHQFDGMCEFYFDDDEDVDLSEVPQHDSVMLRDYWNNCKALGWNLDDSMVRWPRELHAAHDRASAAYRDMQNKAKMDTLREGFARRYAELLPLSFSDGSLMIVPCETPEQLAEEGDAQHHCVGQYDNKHASGISAIFFIRRCAAPDMSYFTLEYDDKKQTVLQNRGLRNRARTDEVSAFEKLWLRWIKAGCQKTEDGTPVLGRERIKAKASA